MGLREEYDQAVREKTAETRQKEDLQAKDRLVPEEVRSLLKTCWDMGLFEVFRDGEPYYFSLPIQLPPGSRALIGELIELCPPRCWIASDDYPPKGNCLLQYRVADGSLHIGCFDMPAVEKKPIRVEPEFRLTRKGREAAYEEAKALSKQKTEEAYLAEVRRIWDEKVLHNPMVAGSREYIWLNNRREIVVFRDGTVYQPVAQYSYEEKGPERMTKRLLANPVSVAYIRQECTGQVQKWAAMA